MGFAEWGRQELARLESGSRVVETAKGPVEVAELGEGQPILVLHGRPGGYDQGLLIARTLGEGLCRWLAVSRPGYLRTPLDTGRTPAEQAEAYAALLDILGISRVAVVALSGGGPSALEFAKRHADRCRGVVLASTVTKRKSPDERPAGQRFLDWVCESDRRAWGLYRVVGPLAGQAGREAMATALVLPGSQRSAGRLNDMDQFARLGDAPASGITAPTLIVHGKADRIVRFDHAEAARAAIPGAELMAVPGAGHSVLFTHAARVRPGVASFLGSLPCAG
jgi:pimeloyl-ACP methyl ester carboxylesterase